MPQQAARELAHKLSEQGLAHTFILQQIAIRSALGEKRPRGRLNQAEWMANLEGCRMLLHPDYLLAALATPKELEDHERARQKLKRNNAKQLPGPIAAVISHNEATGAIEHAITNRLRQLAIEVLNNRKPTQRKLIPKVTAIKGTLDSETTTGTDADLTHWFVEFQPMARPRKPSPNPQNRRQHPR